MKKPKIPMLDMNDPDFAKQFADAIVAAKARAGRGR